MITVRNVTKYFHGPPVLSGVSLEVQRGETVVIWGPSGSGKSTLLRLIAGLELPDAGEIWIDDLCVSTSQWATAPYTRGIGYMFQRSALWPHMTVTKNIAFGLNSATKEHIRERVNLLLKQMAIAHLAERYPEQLSGGEARRVALARALAPQPKYLLLDEPLTSLDPALREILLKVIMAQVRSTQGSLIYVTHNQDELEPLGGRKMTLERKSTPSA